MRESLKIATPFIKNYPILLPKPNSYGRFFTNLSGKTAPAFFIFHDWSVEEQAAILRAGLAPQTAVQMDCTSNKDQLLLVLDYPSLSLHNNAAELGARKMVRKRDISLHTWTDWGYQTSRRFPLHYRNSQKVERIGL